MSVISNAAVRTKTTRAETLPEYMQRLMSFRTLMRAVSVPWWCLYPEFFEKGSALRQYAESLKC